MSSDVEEIVTSILEAAHGRDVPTRSPATGAPDPAWKALAEGGFPWVGLPEDQGGSGGSLVDLVGVLCAAGRTAASVPLAETALGSWLRVRAGLGATAGPGTVCIRPPKLTLTETDEGWSVDGELLRVPFAQHADEVVVALATGRAAYVVALPLGACSITPGANLANEGRDTVRIEHLTLPTSAVAAVSPELADAAHARGALLRAAQMSGALRAVGEMTVRYAATRHQFGRPLATFQLIQTRLALIEEGAAAVDSAVGVAARALDRGAPGPSIAAAKVLAGVAADEVVAHSHQIHGALGLTAEYGLQPLVRRLASWRWEFGSARHWSHRLAADVTAPGGPFLWDNITHSLTDRTN